MHEKQLSNLSATGEFTYQLRFFCINSHDHVLVGCWQQVTNAIIWYGEFLLTLVILRNSNLKFHIQMKKFMKPSNWATTSMPVPAEHG